MAMLAGGDKIDKVAKSLYRNNHGEIEARATAERIDMKKALRRKTPIVNEGNTYYLADIQSKFIDNLRSMGYTDTQIRKEMDGEKINRRSEENKSRTRGRNIDGTPEASEYIDPNRQSSQRRATNTRGERKNQEGVHDGGVKHSVSEEIETESKASYEQLKRQLENQKQRNRELAGELKRTHSKKLDPKAVTEMFREIALIEQITVKNIKSTRFEKSNYIWTKTD